MDHSEKVYRKPHPRDRANIFSLVTFAYTIKMFLKGFKKDFEDDDLYDVVKCCQSKKSTDKLEHAYKAARMREKSSIFRILWDAYGLRYITLGCFHLTWKLIQDIMEPEAISNLVGYFEHGQTQITFHDAIYYATVLITLKILHCLYFQNYFIFLHQLALEIRASFCSLIYRKTLKLSPKALARISLGNIVTVITKDVSQFEQAITLFNELWIAVVQTIVICYLIYNKIGWSSSVGVTILLSLLPVQAWISKAIKVMRTKINKRTDERLQTTQETLSAIRIIKMYTWEKIFENKISATRRSELAMMLRNFYSKIVLVVTSMLVAKLGFYALIMVYIYVNNNVNAKTIFYVMKAFTTLRYTVSLSLALGFTRIGELIASLNRIENILNAEELSDSVDKPDDDPQLELRKISVSFNNNTILKDINLKMNVGLNILTGQLGSGKSSLIKVILKDIPVDVGEIRTRGRKSYASQDAWLFPSSIRQNILFGEKYDEKRYKEVVKVCELEYDFSILEKGDETILVDRGLNLSKGQQARVNLARAVYKDSDIYLIDDALTALDSRVQEQIFRECIRGFLKDKLVLLVTHNSKHIESAERVIILEEGSIKFDGKKQELSRNILEGIEDVSQKQDDEDKDVDDETDEKAPLIKGLPIVRRRQVYHECKKEGGVSFDIYKKYLSFGGGIFFFLLVIFLYTSATITESASSKLLSNWVNQQEILAAFRKNITFSILNVSSEALSIGNVTSPINTFQNDTNVELKRMEHQSSKKLNIYSILLIGSTILELIKHYCILKFAINASVRIHKNMMKNVIHSVMAFFDNVFIGNILNRFSQDLNVIDEHLPFMLNMLIGMCFQVIGMVGILSSVNLLFLLPAILLFVSLVLMRYLYIPTARSLKRLEAATRSPLVGHLNSSMEGLTTIRAYKAQDILKEEFDKHQDLYTSAHYTSLVAKRAFAFAMDIFTVFFLCYILGRFLFFDTDTPSGDVGLTLTHASAMSHVIQMALMQWSETENLMTSVERVLEYTNCKNENEEGLEISDWPKKGEITYVNVSLTYTNSNERVLKNINFNVKSKQKIGIVGRTGAGKSSIISTLFRIYDFEGQIFIDDVETKTLGLKFLRQRISIIPQDPIIFSGTIRSNVDPLNVYTDEEVWKTLHKVHLDKTVPDLTYHIEDLNFSTGQRQLICLARAIIKKNKIVVLDEATANMDPETEFLVQKTIIENFSSCTVFIIAHRLQSILDCHKVMVMEKGEIMEFDDPLKLMEDKNSMFSHMLKNAGLDDTTPEEIK